MGTTLSGRVALVVGGTGELGRAVSLAFLEEGASVFVTYRRPEELTALKATAGANGRRLDGRDVDVTDEAAVRELTGTVLARHGRLDAVVNAVGGTFGGTTLRERGASVVDQMLELNVRSGYALSRAVVPSMLAQGHGAIVIVAARAAVDDAAGNASYTGSKAAALAVLESLAPDLHGTGVRVNSILPSMADRAFQRSATPHVGALSWPRAEDIARVVLFLCSDDAKVIRGAAIPVYGVH